MPSTLLFAEILMKSTILTSGRALALTALLLAGCGEHAHKHEHPKTKPSGPVGTMLDTKAQADEEEAAIKAEAQKLSEEDQRLVAAQEWCPISDDVRLGEHGKPIKIMVKDQPVFLCCGGCKKDALDKPDDTLAKVEKLKAKVKAAAEKK